MTPVSLDIVTTLREILPLTLAYVAHHLEQGVRMMHLYFDDPHDPAIESVAGIDQVRVTRCDAGYWAGRGGRPDMIVARQTANAKDCQIRAVSPWLLHCDADEFLISGRSVLRHLAGMRPGVDVLRLPVWERCFAPDDTDPGLFGGHCRGPVLAPNPVYGAAAGALMNRGMVAYAGCKSVTRVAAGLTIGIHDSVAVPSGRNPRPRRVLRKMLLLPQIVHIDGLTPLHAAFKMRDRAQDVPGARRGAIMHKARIAQIDALSDPATDHVAYFHDLRRVQQTAYRALMDLHLIAPMPVDPAGAALRRWPLAAPLFNPATFDRMLLDTSARFDLRQVSA